MKPLLLTLPALLLLALLAGCPQSKVPDTPPMVPQPKATMHLVGKAAGIKTHAYDSGLAGHWQLSRIAAP